ncbi:tyrosine-type recombinase/integrase [Paucibacter sp. TC2R-5]|uniref:tyrosine-type recombinase/integrase n=1 Tax=Paucibacter sp. TC2R-5 TaxID=2893555 RepID=UPI0021E3B7DF|nr:tyrosine-type recombinase/integrase [Paucibacter sp. TC2R-5]MCV2361642.1 tyrosine-type recombinase/integrase [Paucibacter sp. TC2R-5]
MDALNGLPRLPSVIRYEDDFDEQLRTLKPAECLDSMVLHVSGQRYTLKFARLDIRIRPLIRAYLLFSIQDLMPSTVVSYFDLLTGIASADIEAAALSEPLAMRRNWRELVAKYSTDALASLRGLLGFLCRMRFGPWCPLHVSFVSRALPLKARDRYSTVRAGDCFVTIEEEARLVRWIDDQASRAFDLGQSDIELACLLVSSYQFGMRPKQLAMLRKQDCSVRVSEVDGSATVLLSFKMLKQRDPALASLRLNRKVKREWAPLFVALMQRRASEGEGAFFFGFAKVGTLSTALIARIAKILPDGNRTAYDFRHSMAQRLVDAGASHEDLAAALGHSSLRTSNVYFAHSANQAELVNKALGVSETYRTVAKIAGEKFLSPDELASLRGDQQVAGVPHGIPIAGIGGCTTGQPSCELNPISSCYGCPKFMPVRDVALHEQVLTDFRSVVTFYKDSGRGEQESPAYLQLQRTISEVQGVLRELKGSDE